MKKEVKILILIGSLAIANLAFAQVDVGQMIEGIINFVINVATIGAGIIIIIGGYWMVASAGDPQKFETGKKTLLYGAIGFILIFAAKELAEEIMSIIK